MRELRYVLRQFRRTPLFFCAAVATLAIGTAATTAIFSTVNATVLRPLPYPDSDRLVDVHTRALDGRVTTGLLSGVEIDALNGLHDQVARAGGFLAQPLDATIIRSDGTPVPIVATGVTDGFFDALGLPMALGRAFTHDEHVRVKGNPPPILIVSYSAWKTLLNGDPNIVGRTIRLAEVPEGARVVGVASPEMDMPHGVQFWFNARLGPQAIDHNYGTVLRLKPGVTLDALRASSDAAMATLGRTYSSDASRAYVMQPLVTYMVGDLRTTLLIVLGATLLLLVLASVNVTNLLLARGTGRAREVAVRSALGASRGRVVRQMLLEAAVLAVSGAAAGVLLAMGAVRIMLAMGASKLPRLATVPFDGRVLLFTLAVLTASALVMAAAPAWRLSGVDIRTLLNESGRSATASRGTSRTMAALIVTEIAVALALVAGAGWLVQSFARLRWMDPGFIASGRLVVDIRATKRFRGPADGRAWFDGVMESLRAAAPDARVGAAATFPFETDRDDTLYVQIGGRVRDPGDMTGARIRYATDGFFEAMGIRLVAGRLPSPADRPETEHVAVVNRAFVRTFFHGADPLNQTFGFGYPDIDPHSTTRIVGVVDDVRYKSLAEPAQPACYLVAGQQRFPLLRFAAVVAPPSGDPEALTGPLRAALARFDPQAVAGFTTAGQIVGESLQRQQLGMTLMLIFGAAALALAAIGIYGVIAYVAAQRRAEIATRLALGASRGDVFRLMVGYGQRLGLVGLTIGIAAAYAGGRVLAGSVFGIRASDPLVLAGACVAVAAATLAATAIPAARACRVDPAVALRPE